MRTKALLLIPMALTLFSCEQLSNNDNSEPKEKITSKRTAQESDVEYSARLARIGEILVNNPVGITESDFLFNKALELNPNNDKALFYSAFTGIVLANRGIMNRGKALLEDSDVYDKSLSYLNDKLKYPEFINFFIGSNTQSKLSDYQDIKRFVQVDIVDAFDRASIKLNKISSSVELILTQLRTDNSQTEDNCQQITEEEYTYTQCEVEENMTGMSALAAKTFTVDATDTKILANSLKAYAAAFKMFTAYSIEGQKNLTNEVKVMQMELDRDLTKQELARVVSRYDNYLVLEKDHKINEVVKDLEDIVSAGMDLETLNNQFCDNDLREAHIIKTICLNEGSREGMQKALDLLSGPQEVSLGKTKDGSDILIVVDLPAFLNNPVKDLKKLQPNSYSSDGSAQYTEEPNLNGLFPNKDLLKKIEQLKSK